MERVDFNLDHFWMPFTDNKYFKSNPKLLMRADGKYYYDRFNKQILDASSGLLCCPLGHNRAEIIEAINTQLKTLDFAPHFQVGHPYSFQYAQKLVSELPALINHCFFTNSGSESVETGLKIALAYQQARGKESKTILIGRDKSYHGTNFGGTSIGGMINNRKQFPKLLPDVHHICHTLNINQNAFSKKEPAWGAHLADDLLRVIELEGADRIAALIVEPVAGSVGVIPPPQNYLKRLRKICEENDILLIFDEVITGFGRLGKGFAADYFDVVPDIMLLAKAMTNGLIPMGAVCVQEKVYDALINSVTFGVELFHGYTYSVNPVSSAAALSVLNIFELESSFHCAEQLSPLLEEAIFSLRELPYVIDIRNIGLMAGVELKSAPEGVGLRARKVFEDCFSNGVLVRFNGDTLTIAPPFIINKDDILRIVDVVKNAISMLK